MQYSIQIPKPCSESWEDMTPAHGGRHCAACSKTVIDFTGWPQEAVHAFMDRQGAAKICGRFRPEQLDEPVDNAQFVQKVARLQMPLCKKIAAIFLFAFGLLQSPEHANAQTNQKSPPTGIDTSVKQHRIMGGVAASPHIDTATHHSPHIKPKPKPKPMIMGKPAYRP